jgi:hypothetical protein
MSRQHRPSTVTDRYQAFRYRYPPKVCEEPLRPSRWRRHRTPHPSPNFKLDHKSSHHFFRPAPALTCHSARRTAAATCPTASQPARSAADHDPVRPPGPNCRPTPRASLPSVSMVPPSTVGPALATVCQGAGQGPFYLAWTWSIGPAPLTRGRTAGAARSRDRETASHSASPESEGGEEGRQRPQSPRTQDPARARRPGRPGTPPRRSGG